MKFELILNVEPIPVLSSWIAESFCLRLNNQTLVLIQLIRTFWDFGSLLLLSSLSVNWLLSGRTQYRQPFIWRPSLLSRFQL